MFVCVENNDYNMNFTHCFIQDVDHVSNNVDFTPPQSVSLVAALVFVQTFHSLQLLAVCAAVQALGWSLLAGAAAALRDPRDVSPPLITDGEMHSRYP